VLIPPPSRLDHRPNAPRVKGADRRGSGPTGRPPSSGTVYCGKTASSSSRTSLANSGRRNGQLLRVGPGLQAYFLERARREPEAARHHASARFGRSTNSPVGRTWTCAPRRFMLASGRRGGPAARGACSVADTPLRQSRHPGDASMENARHPRLQAVQGDQGRPQGLHTALPPRRLLTRCSLRTPACRQGPGAHPHQPLQGAPTPPHGRLPYHSAQTYIRKLIESGHRVAVCEQVEDPKKARGVVKREVVASMTRGTVTEDSLLEERAHNWLAAAFPAEPLAGLAWIDLSTASSRLPRSKPGGLAGEVERLGPAECLLPEGREEDPLARLLATQGISVEFPPAWTFQRKNALDALTPTSPPRRWRDRAPRRRAAVCAAGAVMRYLTQTQRDALGQVTRIALERPADFMEIDRRHLPRPGDHGDDPRRRPPGDAPRRARRSVTPQGARLLREWLTRAPAGRRGGLRPPRNAVAELVEKGDGPRRPEKAARRRLRPGAARVARGGRPAPLRATSPRWAGAFAPSQALQGLPASFPGPFARRGGPRALRPARGRAR